MKKGATGAPSVFPYLYLSLPFATEADTHACQPKAQ